MVRDRMMLGLSHLKPCKGSIQEDRNEEQNSTPSKATRIFVLVVEHAPKNDRDDEVADYGGNWGIEVVLHSQ